MSGKARHSDTKPAFSFLHAHIHFGQLTSILQNFNQKLKIYLFWNWHFYGFVLLEIWSFICYSSSFHSSCFALPVKSTFSSLISLTIFFYFLSLNDWNQQRLRLRLRRVLLPDLRNTERCCRKVAEKQTATRTAWR